MIIIQSVFATSCAACSLSSTCQPVAQRSGEVLLDAASATLDADDKRPRVHVSRSGATVEPPRWTTASCLLCSSSRVDRISSTISFCMTGRSSESSASINPGGKRSVLFAGLSYQLLLLSPCAMPCRRSRMYSCASAKDAKAASFYRADVPFKAGECFVPDRAILVDPG